MVPTTYSRMNCRKYNSEFCYVMTPTKKTMQIIAENIEENTRQSTRGKAKSENNLRERDCRRFLGTKVNHMKFKENDCMRKGIAKEAAVVRPCASSAEGYPDNSPPVNSIPPPPPRQQFPPRQSPPPPPTHTRQFPPVNPPPPPPGQFPPVNSPLPPVSIPTGQFPPKIISPDTSIIMNSNLWGKIQKLTK